MSCDLPLGAMRGDIVIDHNNKSSWCRFGELKELEFTERRFEHGIRFEVNEEKKAGNKYALDLRMSARCDYKGQFTRFETADRYGINPRTAITLNAKDVARYQPMSAFCPVVFDINYGDFQSVRIAPMREINRLISKGYAKPMTYRYRQRDGSGNALEGYVFDALWFGELKELAGGSDD